MKTIKEYLDEIEWLKQEARTLMVLKFPVGTEVEYYRGSVPERAIVVAYAKEKFTLRVKRPGGGWPSPVYWVNAILCEPENPIDVRTWPTGSNTCKIRLRKEREERDV